MKLEDVDVHLAEIDLPSAIHLAFGKNLKRNMNKVTLYDIRAVCRFCEEL